MSRIIVEYWTQWQISERLFKTLLEEDDKTSYQEYILQETKTYKKLNYINLKKEKFGTKEYIKQMNVSDARLNFRMRVQSVPGIKYSFKNKYKD